MGIIYDKESDVYQRVEVVSEDEVNAQIIQKQGQIKIFEDRIVADTETISVLQQEIALLQGVVSQRAAESPDDQE